MIAANGPCRYIQSQGPMLMMQNAVGIARRSILTQHSRWRIAVGQPWAPHGISRASKTAAEAF